MRYPLASLLVLASLPLFAGSGPSVPDDAGTMVVSFQDHGEERQCSGMAVLLRFEGQELTPAYTKDGFIIPLEFKRLNDSGEGGKHKLDVTVTCGSHTLSFPDVYASWLSPGHWTIGIDYPPFQHFTHHGTPEKGAWVSYLSWGGWEQWIAHPEPLAGTVEALRAEQPQASGGRARDIAYALAVFKENYQANRDYLIDVLVSCLGRPKGSPGGGVCDYELLDYVVNLYWRGDDSLLLFLVGVADSRMDPIGDVGTFYADVFERHPDAALKAVQTIAPERRGMVCRLVGLSASAQQLRRVNAALRASTDPVAKDCQESVGKGAASGRQEPTH